MSEPLKAIRTLKIEFHPTAGQRDLLYRMMRSSARIYNLLIEHLRYKQQAWRQAKDEKPDQKPWEVDPYVDIQCKGWADELIIALITQQASVYPRQLVDKPAKQGRYKGLARLVTATEKHAKPDYGIPAQSKGALCRDFEANIASYFTHCKNGNSEAALPKRSKGLHTLFFTNQLVKRCGDRLFLGAKPYVLKLRVPELLGIAIDGDVKISRSRSGKFCLHITRKLPVERNPALNAVAAVDFGQKRAIVIAVQTRLGEAETATISGKNICALKRERDRRYREINRLRSRVLKGQIRQYLTQEEKQTYRRLQEADKDRQQRGKPRRGSDIKYALRLIRRQRQELGLKKRSRREQQLRYTQNKAADYYRLRLTYANHCVTRAAVNWAVDRSVGKIYVGDLKTLPKGRKKGRRRVKQVGRNNLWEMPNQAKYLGEKLQLAGGEGTEEASERLSSQVCPNCGRRHKPRNRVYHCKLSKGGCGWVGDRDGVGSANFLSAVTTGTCGNLKPVRNQTLRLAPAIRGWQRQGLPMRKSNERIKNQKRTSQDAPASCRSLPMRGSGSDATCDSAEDVAKGYKSADLQGSGTVQTPVTPKTARKPLLKGKTQRRGGKAVLAEAKIADPTGLDDTCSQATTSKTGGNQQWKSLQNQSGHFVQLELWDLA